jgi:NADPH:quinone reductase-like Zn-dependent oxidoreductase
MSASHGVSLVTGDNRDGGFALYSSAPAGTTARLPDSISFTEGSVLPLAFDTAAVGLYSTGEGFLGLPHPSTNPSSTGKTLVVWGGSSSVGALAIQLAVASGLKVVATASKHNFDFVKKCGASEVHVITSNSQNNDC